MLPITVRAGTEIDYKNRSSVIKKGCNILIREGVKRNSTFRGQVP